MTSHTVVEGVATIPAATTAALEEGIYAWVFVEADETESYTVTSGDLQVERRADLKDQSIKSHARITLDAIEAVIEGRASKAQQSYSIKDRSISFYALSELIELRKYYKELVMREETKTRPQIFTRLNR